MFAKAQQIVETLAHFRIRGKVTKVHPGPVVTRFEFKPEAGVKLSKIEALENDLALALEAMRSRIHAILCTCAMPSASSAAAVL